MRSGVDLFSSLLPVDSATYRSEFSNFESSAKRLELHPAYSVPSEDDALAAFAAGRPLPTFNAGWHDTIRGARSRGAIIQRLRGLMPYPTDYLKFEIMAYQDSATVGEQLRFHFLSDIEASVDRSVALIDFWIFDSARAYAVFYDSRGVYLGPKALSKPDVGPLESFFNSLFLVGKPLSWAATEYAAIHNKPRFTD